MSKISQYNIEIEEDELAPEVELPIDFNYWMKEVDKDKDYIAKWEKKLDDELGENRLF